MYAEVLVGASAFFCTANLGTAYSLAMRFLGLMLLFACGTVYGAGARLGFEYEREKDRQSGISSDAVTAEFGWDFEKDSLINSVELSVERNRDSEADTDGFRERETKVFVRLRHSHMLTKYVGYYLRGGVGRSFNNERDFSYAYIEPGLQVDFLDCWEWKAGMRHIDSIGSSDGQLVREFQTGPTYKFDKRNEVEIRYIRGRGDKDFKAWSIGYSFKF